MATIGVPWLKSIGFLVLVWVGVLRDAGTSERLILSATFLPGKERIHDE